VRAGVVRHPAKWEHGGYGEIQEPPDRYRLIDLAALSALCGFSNVAAFQVGHRQWVDAALRMGAMTRDDRWSESVAVGSEEFVEQVKTELGSTVGRRQIAAENKTYTLREPSPPYNHLFEGNNGALSQNNAYLWDTILDSTDT